MLVTISKLAKKYPNINFIVRPHPFESCRVYEQSLTEKNIHIIKEGSSMAWIKSAEMLIHLNCTTAIESFFLNVPSVNLKWLSHPILDAPIAEEASNFNASSFDDLLGYIEKFFASKHVLKKIKKSKVTEFYSNTGISSKIIAKKIAQGLKSNISKEVKLYSYMDLKIFLRVLFGFHLFNYITKLFKSAIYKKREGKQINLLFVNDLLNRISRKNFKFRGVHYPTTPSFSFLYKWVASNRIIEIKKIS